MTSVSAQISTDNHLLTQPSIKTYIDTMAANFDNMFTSSAIADGSRNVCTLPTDGTGKI